MKKITIIISALMLLFSSCEEKQNLQELAIPKSDEESKIADLEKSGVALFKRDLKISDVSGENFVIVQVASEDKIAFEDYFSNTVGGMFLNYLQSESIYYNPRTSTREFGIGEEMNISIYFRRFITGK